MKKRLLVMMTCMFVVAPAVFGDLTTTGDHTNLNNISVAGRMCSGNEGVARTIPEDMQQQAASRPAAPASTSVSAEN